MSRRLKKYTIKEVKKYFKEHGCELISKEYKNCITKMKYKCSFGDIHKATFASFKIGYRCLEYNDKKRNKFKEVKDITKKQMSIFDGLMISDAYLKKISGKSRNSRFVLTTSIRGFRDKVFNMFPNFPWSDASLRTINVYDKRTNKYYESNRLRSLSTIFFTEQRKRWYPNGKKIIPKDIEINRDMLLWWYIGDGYLCRKKIRPNYRRAELATDSFSMEDVYFIIDKLKLILGESSIYEENNEIMIGRQALVKFANLLGGVSPVKDYQYKFEFGRYFNEDYYERSQNEKNYKGGLKYISKTPRGEKNGKIIYKYKYENRSK